jgi:hypothetical protein
MKITTIFIVSLFALTTTVHAAGKSHAGKKSSAVSKQRSNSIVIEAPGDLPEMAQRHSEGMYLHTNGTGQAFLYLEQDQGRTLAILDVSDPASIRESRRITVDAKSSYDFVQYMGKSLVLVRYRDGSGYAAINVGENKQPVLTVMTGLPDSSMIQNIDQHTVLFASTNSLGKATGNNQVEVVDFSNPSAPVALVTVHGLVQKLDRQDTGTVFLLGDNGLTVLRRPSLEEEYQLESTYTN